MVFTLTPVHGPIAEFFREPRASAQRSNYGISTEALRLLKKYRTHGTLRADSDDGTKRIYVTRRGDEPTVLCSHETLIDGIIATWRQDVRDMNTLEVLSSRIDPRPPR